MPFQVRLATAGDAALISAIGREAFYAAFSPYQTAEDMQMYLDASYYPAKLLVEIQDTKCRFLLLEEDHVPIGFAKIVASLPTENEGVDIFDKDVLTEKLMLISKIYLLPQFAGKRIGHLLMDECCLIAQDEGYDGVWLCVWQQNERAIKFYEKYEFKKIGYTQFLLGKSLNDDFVMAKIF
ncbi:MAG: GNAT family N-acetyltransferase [Cytophagales bacterium]|nr:MAG: GNAT family N-acetyltransferase [Cytophagales bacterium]